MLREFDAGHAMYQAHLVDVNHRRMLSGLRKTQIDPLVRTGETFLKRREG